MSRLTLRPARRTLAAAMVAASTLLTPALASAQTIGNALIPRAAHDDFQGFVLVSPYTFGIGDYGKSLTSVSIYSTRLGYKFTPLVLNFNGGTSYTVAAIGAENTVTTSGISSFAFAPVSGSAVIGADTRFAWMSPAGQGGAIPYDNGGDVFGYTNNGSKPSAVGETFQVPGPAPRQYSIQWTVSPVSTVPEPMTWALMVPGLLVIGAAARRRTRQG